MVRDNGVVGSIEFRVPVPMRSFREWRPRLELAPFVDVGHSWNTDRPEFGRRTIVSAGIGARLQVTPRSLFEIYWGESLRNIDNPQDDRLQDDGIHLRFSWNL